MRIISVVSLSVWMGLSVASAAVDAAETHVAFLDPAEAGPDFLVQGEYVGLAGDSHPLAAQVIASGDGRFEGVLYAGGLPGAGWDEAAPDYFRGETREGVTHFVGIHGEKLMFENPSFDGRISDGVLRGRASMYRNRVRNSAFEMKRVERQSPTLGAEPPPGAVVLFDGSGTDEWIDGKLIEQRLLDNGATTKRLFGDRDFRFHLEFRTPFMPMAGGMKRGNSGVYIKKIWEIQILDSFGWDNHNRKFERLADFGRCGGIHEMVEPRLNMCFPPLTWQTYDVEFQVPRKAAGDEAAVPEMISVWHNGVLIHDRYVLPSVSPGGDLSKSRTGELGPIYLQHHGNPVRFRNIWVTVAP